MRRSSGFVLGALLIVAAGVWAGPLAGPGDDGVVPAPAEGQGTIDRPGRFLWRYLGPRLEVIVDTRHAQSDLGRTWVILNVAISGEQGKSVEIPRKGVFLETPDGTRVGIPDPQEFASRFGEISAAARRAMVAADPLDFARAGRRPCSLAFQPLPQQGVAADSVWVNVRRICTGFLYFPLGHTVEPGTYHLVIELEDGTTIRVPFTLGSEEAPPPTR